MSNLSFWLPIRLVKNALLGLKLNVFEVKKGENWLTKTALSVKGAIFFCVGNAKGSSKNM
jgi:hypothetical protein